MLDDIFDLFSQRSGLSSTIARMALPLVTSFLLRNITPQRASGFISVLPSSITNMFSNDEKQKFVTTQENVSEDELIDQISRECCNGDREKGEKVYQQAVKILRENTKGRQKEQQGQQNQKQEEDDKGGFLDGVFDSLKRHG
jgi:hypothetical protein